NRGRVLHADGTRKSPSSRGPCASRPRPGPVSSAIHRADFYINCSGALSRDRPAVVGAERFIGTRAFAVDDGGGAPGGPCRRRRFGGGERPLQPRVLRTAAGGWRPRTESLGSGVPR